MGKIRNALFGLGLLALSYTPLRAQENPLAVKVGIMYNIVQANGVSKNCLGIETLLERKLKNKLFAEWDIGYYADMRPTSAFIYSKMQTNMGLEYKPLMKKGWSAGGKLALGISSEFYKPIERAKPTHRIALNKLVGIDIEKVFKNGRGINVSASKEVDRNIWIVGAKVRLKPENKGQNNYPKRNYYPWPDF